MLDFKINVSKVDVALKVPTKDRRFWATVGVDVARQIDERSTKGRDYKGQPFKPYDPAYAKKKGVSRNHVDLQVTGKMLGALQSGVRAAGNGVKLVLSGAEGFKAYVIHEKQKRQFFDFSKDDTNTIIKKVNEWLTRKNGLK